VASILNLYRKSFADILVDHTLEIFEASRRSP